MGIVYHHANETTLQIHCNNLVIVEMAAIYEEITAKITINITQMMSIYFNKQGKQG